MTSNVQIKDPSAVLPYTWDWADALESGDTISSATVTAPSGITKDSQSNTTTTVTAKMSGGTADTTYEVVCRITTAAGYVDERTMVFKVRNR